MHSTLYNIPEPVTFGLKVRRSSQAELRAHSTILNTYFYISWIMRERSFTKLVRRPSHSTKYDFGHLLIIGGSKHYTGPPLFNALAAYTAGVDIATIAAPRRAADAAAFYSPDIIAYPLSGDEVGARHFNELCSLVRRKATAILVGGGMGRTKSAFALIAKMHGAYRDIPFIFDADALYGLGYLQLRPHDLVMPNKKEFGVICGGMAEDGPSVKTVAGKMGCTLLVKGERDIVSDGYRYAEIKSNKNVAVLAKGGTGDMLAGMCASFIAQGMNAYDAAVLGARIMKRAGERAACRCGPFFMPSELLGYLADELHNRAKSKCI